MPTASNASWEWVPSVQTCQAPAWAQAAYGQPEPELQQSPPPEPCTAPAWAQRAFRKHRKD